MCVFFFFFLAYNNLNFLVQFVERSVSGWSINFTTVAERQSSGVYIYIYVNRELVY